MIRLVHLSDLHLSPVPWPLTWPPRLKPVLGYINHLRHRPPEHDSAVLARTLAEAQRLNAQHHVVTGDLIEIGHAAEYARAAEVLSTLSAPVIIAPGNHDLYTTDTPARLLPPWRPYLPPTPNTPPPDLRDLFPRIDRLGPATLITLCSGLPTWTFSAEGAIGEPQLQRLDRLLTAETQAPSIVALHHPPHAPGLSRLKRLRDGDKLIDLLIARGVGLVLHGHLHVATDHTLTRATGKPLRCIGAPSASATQGAGFVSVALQAGAMPRVQFHATSA